MSDIPEDIMKAAIAAHEVAMKADIEDEPFAVARAILAERERCAKKVEAGLGLTNTAIARHIRSGE